MRLLGFVTALALVLASAGSAFAGCYDMQTVKSGDTVASGTTGSSGHPISRPADSKS
jgi:hypothetical protein